jgi:Zn-dependent protease
MIWFLGDLLDNPPALAAYLAAAGVAILGGIAFHEFCHAWAASELGDQTAARQGRLTLNPMVHIDPIGVAALVLIGFGWGRPTPVNPYNLSIGPHRGNAVVALAGPASNFFFAILAAIPLRLGLVPMFSNISMIGDASGMEILGFFLFMVVYFNVLLGIFNLIPIHPLDGFKVVTGLAPREIGRQLEALAPYGPGILITLLVVGFILPQFAILHWFIRGVLVFLLEVLL